MAAGRGGAKKSVISAEILHFLFAICTPIGYVGVTQEKLSKAAAPFGVRQSLNFNPHFGSYSCAENRQNPHEATPAQV
jgi:hypothetical protein